MEFHEKLQRLRKQKDLTQEELARELFVSRAAVSKWESGRGYPSIDSLRAIGAFFGISVDELLSGEALLTLEETESAPALAEQETLLEAWSIHLNEQADTFRFRLPEEVPGDQVKVYMGDGQGSWKEIAVRQDGNCLVFPAEAGYTELALVQVRGSAPIWIILAGAAVLAAATFFFAKKRKTGKQTKANP